MTFRATLLVLPLATLHWCSCFSWVMVGGESVGGRCSRRWECGTSSARGSVLRGRRPDLRWPVLLVISRTSRDELARLVISWWSVLWGRSSGALGIGVIGRCLPSDIHRCTTEHYKRNTKTIVCAYGKLSAHSRSTLHTPAKFYFGGPRTGDRSVLSPHPQQLATATAATVAPVVGLSESESDPPPQGRPLTRSEAPKKCAPNAFRYCLVIPSTLCLLARPTSISLRLDKASWPRSTSTANRQAKAFIPP